MRIFLLKKRVNRDKCSFSVKTAYVLGLRYRPDEWLRTYLSYYFEYDQDFVLKRQAKVCKSFPKSNNYLEKPLSTKNSSNRPKQTEK